MARLARLLTLTTLGVAVTTGCQPQVIIARQSASGEGGAATAGSGEAGTIALAGEGGTAGAEPEENVRLLADSVADFSLVQGEHGWYYGYDGGSLDSFALMTRTAVITLYVPVTNDVWDCWVNDVAHWTQIFRLGAHPNGTDTSPPSPKLLQRAVRRWVSSFSGAVTISGEIAKIDVAAMGSNGVDASVYVDGMQRYTTFISGEDGGGLSYELTALVHVGSTLDFVLDPHDGDDHHDLSRFTAIVARADTNAPD